MKKILSILFIFGSLVIFSNRVFAAPIGVQQGGTGASTLTGCLQGNGIGAITGTGIACGSGGGGAGTFSTSTLYGNVIGQSTYTTLYTFLQGNATNTSSGFFNPFTGTWTSNIVTASYFTATSTIATSTFAGDITLYNPDAGYKVNGLTLGTGANFEMENGKIGSYYYPTQTSGGTSGQVFETLAQPASSPNITYKNVDAEMNYNSGSYDDNSSANAVFAHYQGYGNGRVNQGTAVNAYSEYDGLEGTGGVAGSLYGVLAESDIVNAGYTGHIMGIKIAQSTVNGSTDFNTGLYIQNQVPTGTGSSTHTDALEIEGVGPKNAIGFGDGGTNIYGKIYSTSTNTINIEASSGLLLDTLGGNVGIATTSPYAALSVVGSTGVVADHYTATSTTATSTFANGINFIGGCPAINNVCITGGGGSLSGLATGDLQYAVNSTTLGGTSSPTVGYITATSTATSTFAGPISLSGSSAGLVSVYGNPQGTATTTISTGTSTFQGGINILSGCYEINGTCFVGGSGGGSSGGGFTFIPGGIYNSTTTDQVMIGETATTTLAKLEVAQTSLSGLSVLGLGQVGILGEAKSLSGSAQHAQGIVGYASTNGSSAGQASYGVVGIATSSSPSDSGANFGGYFQSTAPATSNGINTGVYSIASGGLLANYSFYGSAGTLYNKENVGIATSSPYAALSVVGASGVVADHYTATSSVASLLPYASSTALTDTTLYSTQENIGTTSTAVTCALCVQNSGSTNAFSLSNTAGNSLFTIGNTGILSVGAGQTFAINNSGGSNVLSVSNSSLTVPAGNMQINAGGLQLQGGITTPASGLYTSGYSTAFLINNWLNVTGNGSSKLGLSTSTPAALLSISNTVSTPANTPLLMIASTTGGTATTTFMAIYANGQTNLPYASSTAFSAPTICVGTDCRTAWPAGGSGASYDWLQQLNNYSVNSLTPTTTIPIQIKSTSTSTFAGGLEAWKDVGSPYFLATSSTATSTFSGGFVAGNNNIVENFSTGSTTLSSAVMGNLIFDTDSGAVTALDLPIDSTPTSGTTEAYSFNLMGSTTMTIYGQADGAGNVKGGNWGIGIGTSTPSAGLDVNANIKDEKAIPHYGTGANTAIVCYTSDGTLGYITITSLMASGSCNSL